MKYATQDDACPKCGRGPVRFGHSHPIWNLIRLSVVMIALTAILWFTASKFDQTEIQTIITMFIAAAGVEGVTATVLRAVDARKG